MWVIQEYVKQSLKEVDLYYYISNLVDANTDFNQWEFCIMWATHFSFLPVLSAVPSFIDSLPLGTADQSCYIACVIFMHIVNIYCQYTCGFRSLHRDIFETY